MMMGCSPELSYKAQLSASFLYAFWKLSMPDLNLRRIVASGMLCPPAATLAATRLMANSALGSDKNTKVIF